MNKNYMNGLMSLMRKNTFLINIFSAKEMKHLKKKKKKEIMLKKQFYCLKLATISDSAFLGSCTGL